MILERVMQGIIKRKKLDIALRVETASCLTYLRRGTVIPKSQQVCYKESGVLGQYIPSGNEDILHRRFNIYCNCLRIYTASANEVYLHFQRSRIGKLRTCILGNEGSKCYSCPFHIAGKHEKQAGGNVYHVLCDFLVLFAPVLRQIARYLPHHRSENASKTHPKSSHDKFKTASYMLKRIFRKSGLKPDRTFDRLRRDRDAI